MTKKESKALRRPFVKELFRGNKFNLSMTVLASLIGAAASLAVSWSLKAIIDLISGESPYSMRTLLIIFVASIAIICLGWVLDHAFLSRFRAKAMRQYRAYVFDRLLEKGIQAFSGENSSLYLSALSNDVNTIEQDFVSKLQNALEVVVTFLGALGLMLWYSPLLTLIAIGFSLLPILVSIVLGDRPPRRRRRSPTRRRPTPACLRTP